MLSIFHITLHNNFKEIHYGTRSRPQNNLIQQMEAEPILANIKVLGFFNKKNL